MYFATDLAPIAAALEAAFRAPRPLAEVAREQYADATIDARGMPHAPHDGYEVDGIVYRGGEYLPITGEYAGMSNGTARYPMLFYVNGEILSLQGTKAQRKAAAAVAKEQAAEFDRTHAQHVGTVGDRADLTLTLVAKFENHDSPFGGWVYYFRDQNNNPVVYKGAAQIMRTASTYKAPLRDGETITMRATVNSHWTARGDGRKATYIKRPKIIG